MVSQSNTSTGSSEIRHRDTYMEGLWAEIFGDAGSSQYYWRSRERQHMEMDYFGTRRECFCRSVAPLFTCWEPGENVGRRYFGCRNWSVKHESPTNWCEFFEWAETVPSPSYHDVINQLMGEKAELKDEVRNIASHVDCVVHEFHRICNAIDEINNRLNAGAEQPLDRPVLVVLFGGILIGILIAIMAILM